MRAGAALPPGGARLLFCALWRKLLLWPVRFVRDAPVASVPVWHSAHLHNGINVPSLPSGLGPGPRLARLRRDPVWTRTPEEICDGLNSGQTGQDYERPACRGEGEPPRGQVEQSCARPGPAGGCRCHSAPREQPPARIPRWISGVNGEPACRRPAQALESETRFRGHRPGLSTGGWRWWQQCV